MRANLRSDPKSIDRSYQLASRSRYASRTINLGPSPPPSRQSDRNIGAEPVRGGGVVSRGPRIPWIESAQCGRFQFVSRSPRGNEGKKKERRNEREEYWPRCKNGSGPIAGGGGERPGVTFHWSACPVSNPFCSALRFPPRLLAGIN